MLDRVTDDELLYRRIPSNPLCFMRESDGTIRISSAAFNDRQQRISVDRARLCNHQPAWTKNNDPAAGVVSLVAQHIRTISDIITYDKRGSLVQKHMIDVVPAPLDENVAHAEIVVEPEAGEKAFRRLRKQLAQLARWEILPADPS